MRLGEVMVELERWLVEGWGLARRGAVVDMWVALGYGLSCGLWWWRRMPIGDLGGGVGLMEGENCAEDKVVG